MKINSRCEIKTLSFACWIKTEFGDMWQNLWICRIVLSEGGTSINLEIRVYIRTRLCKQQELNGNMWTVTVCCCVTCCASFEWMDIWLNPCTIQHMHLLNPSTRYSYVTRLCQLISLTSNTTKCRTSNIKHITLLSMGMAIRRQWKEFLSKAISPFVPGTADWLLRHKNRYLATTRQYLSFVMPSQILTSTILDGKIEILNSIIGRIRGI
jgi:hypothetical protein